MAVAKIGVGNGVALLAAFLGSALWVYGPALDGPFLSDDLHYVAKNAYVHEISLENTWILLQPAGDATAAVVNYTPVHLFLHSLAWKAFGPETRGHHVVNVVFHSLASFLLALLFASLGIPALASVLAGAFFLLHPANVEAVAWISQLKSSSSMVLSLAALLALPRRPGWATGLFVLALFAKPTAVFVLPVAALLEWTSGREFRWKWFAVMAIAGVAYSVAEFAAHQRSGAAEAILYETPFALVRTVLALALRYLVMAATSYGVSAFHEPEPVYSWADPWWLASLPVLALLGWRVVAALRARSSEAAFWAWALISYAPVSQIFPFLYPLADRYLYFIMPGLMGAALLAGGEALERVGDATRVRLSRVAPVVCLAVLALFAARSHERAAIWRSPTTLVADSAANYPNGVSANLLRSKRAAQMGDVDAAIASLRAAVDRGYNRFEQLLVDPGFAPIRNHPRFRALVREIAAGWIERLGRHEDATQLELAMVANAHYVRGEREQAVAMFRRALERGGSQDDHIRAELAALGSPVD
jgi:tetratricopeptide (TPR) repeat protein